MRYRLTALTPLLVGDGHKLAPIDYMVWKDQINVLDQQRIFRLLSKGPRLEGYLGQLRKAEKLDFASWGGFAQNYAERRIPFEHASSSAVWESAHALDLFIPTFASGPHGPYLPASALKGALRTSMASSRWNEGVIRDIAARAGERMIRRPGEAAEAMTIGTGANDSMKSVMAADSQTVSPSVFRVYLLRTGALVERNGKFELAWKTAARGYAPAARPNESTPLFAEMAPPKTSFTGEWKMNGRGRPDRLFQAANEHATKLLDLHREWVNRAAVARLGANIDSLASVLAEVRGRRDACLLNLGWAGGFLGKSAFPDTGNEDYRKILRMLPMYERAIRTGLPFPKTRKVIFEGGEPSNLAGWALLEIS